MNRYSDEIEFDDVNGQLYVNGQATWTAAKEFWMAETDSGKPEIDDVSPGGIDLSETGSISFYENRLYKISKIPIDRFDPSSSESWNLDPTSQRRQEIKFSNFVNDIRDKWSTVMIKPLQIHLCLKIPALVNDTEILDSIVLEYEHNNVFDEMADLELMSRRVEFIEKLQQALIATDPAGREHKFFPRNYLVKQYLKISDEEIETIKKMKLAEDKELFDRGKQEQKEFGDEGDEGMTSY